VVSRDAMGAVGGPGLPADAAGVGPQTSIRRRRAGTSPRSPRTWFRRLLSRVAIIHEDAAAAEHSIRVLRLMGTRARGNTDGVPLRIACHDAPTLRASSSPLHASVRAAGFLCWRRRQGRHGSCSLLTLPSSAEPGRTEMSSTVASTNLHCGSKTSEHMMGSNSNIELGPRYHLSPSTVAVRRMAVHHDFNLLLRVDQQKFV
jgi:hypothetical protein